MRGGRDANCRAPCPALGGPGVQYSEPGLPSLQDLVNIEMFLTAKEVEESLERRETATCLAWCHDNKSRLRKMKVRGGGAPGGAGPRRGGALPGRAPGGGGACLGRACRARRGSATCPRACCFGVVCGCITGACWVWCGFGAVT